MLRGAKLRYKCRKENYCGR